MKIYVRVTPNVRKERVEQIDDTHYRLWVSAPAHDGKANEAAIKALAKHFKIAKSNIELCSGHSSRRKIFDIQ